MKYFIGLLLGLIIISGAALTILALWGITPIEWTHIWKTGVTIAIVCITALVMWLVKLLFFNKEKESQKRN